MVPTRESDAGGRHSEINAGIWQTGISNSVGISKAVLAFPLPISTLVNKNFIFVDVIAISKTFCKKRRSVNCVLLQFFLSYHKFRLNVTFHSALTRVLSFNFSNLVTLK